MTPYQTALRAIIDEANRTMSVAPFAMPGYISAVDITMEGRVARVAVQFDDGGDATAWLAAVALTVWSLVEAAHRAHMFVCLGLDDPSDPALPHMTAWPTGGKPPEADPEEAQTHGSTRMLQ